MTYRLLATDLDGTLLTNDKNISNGTMETLREAMNRGCSIAIATGRAWPGVKRYAKEIPLNGPVITIDGSMIVDPRTEEILYDQPFEYEDVMKLLKMGVERGVTQVIWSRNRLYGSVLDERMDDYSVRFAGGMKPLLAEDYDRLSKDGISKILWYDKPEMVNRWVEELRATDFISLTACTSEPYFVEIFNAKVSKSKALEQVGRIYGIDRSEMIAVGDGGNDMPMIEYAGLGVAMANASDMVKSVADEVTSDNEHDGVAEILRRHVLS